jgi:hypothetical protein
MENVMERQKKELLAIYFIFHYFSPFIKNFLLLIRVAAANNLSCAPINISLSFSMPIKFLPVAVQLRDTLEVSKFFQVTSKK